MAEQIVRADVAIVGGGITGLAAAYRLQKIAPRAKIVLLEGSGRLGGKIGTSHEEGFLVEWGPDCFLSRKPRGMGLSEELGIVDELIGRNPANARIFVLRYGQLHDLPSGLTGLIPTNLDALQNSTLLSAEARVRLAAEWDIPAAPAGPDESVAHFISRRLGQETFENLVEPLMAGIYAGQADQLSLLATFPQLRALEESHGSLLRGLTSQPTPTTTNAPPPFVAFASGMGRMVERLVEMLTTVDIRSNSPVVAIRKAGDGYRLTLATAGQGGELAATSVILTTPAYVTAKLFQQLDYRMATALQEIPYASTVLVNVGFATTQIPPLQGYGYIIPRVENRIALACTWTSRKWPGRAPDGQLLLRVYIGRYGHPDVTEYDDAQLLAIARDELAKTLSIAAEPSFVKIVRYPLSMPQYTMGHKTRLATIQTRLSNHPGLQLAGAAFNGVGIPDCIASGEAAAEAVLTKYTDFASRAQRFVAASE